MPLYSLKRFGRQHIDDRFLKAGRKVRNGNGSALLLEVSEVIEQRGLEAAEAEVQAAAFEVRPRKVHGIGTAAFRQAINRGASGIVEPQHLARLVERFSS